MGLDLVHVFSGVRHKDQLICGICEQLTSLDSFVTKYCAHVFCQECANANYQIQKCPSCSMNVGELQCLSTTQPLAFHILGKMLVACPLRHEQNCHCEWAGDYAALPKHLKSEHATIGNSCPINRRGDNDCRLKRDHHEDGATTDDSDQHSKPPRKEFPRNKPRNLGAAPSKPRRASRKASMQKSIPKKSNNAAVAR